jgi:hypothetical protein
VTLSAAFASPAGLPAIHWSGRQYPANAAANSGTMPLVTVTRPDLDTLASGLVPPGVTVPPQPPPQSIANPGQPVATQFLYLKGATADRPAMTGSSSGPPPVPGTLFYDTDKSKFIWWTGAAWIDQYGMAP